MSSLFKDVEYQWSLVKRESGESDEALAQRLYKIQMDVYSANAGADLVTTDPSDQFRFENLDSKTRESWIEKAKTYK